MNVQIVSMFIFEGDIVILHKASQTPGFIYDAIPDIFDDAKQLIIERMHRSDIALAVKAKSGWVKILTNRGLGWIPEYSLEKITF